MRATAQDGIETCFVQTRDEVEAFMDWISQPYEWMAVDTEAQGLVYKKHRVRMIQFGNMTEGYAIPFEGPRSWNGLVQFAFDRYPGSRFVFHGITFDTSRMEYEGLVIPDWSRLNCTHIMSFLHNNQEHSRKLKMLAQKYVGSDSRQGEIDKNKLFRTRNYTWETVPIGNLIYWMYGIVDTVLTARLAHVIFPHVKPYLRAYDLEMAHARIVKNMHQNGLGVDVEYAHSELDKLNAERESTMYVDSEDHWRLRDGDVRPNFKNDILDRFEALGNVHVPVKISRKTGNTTVDDEVLSRVDHPYAKQVLRARKLNNYIDNYFQMIVDNEIDGRVHPHINPVGSEDSGLSGRISMRDPALITMEKIPYIRDMIIPSEGHKLVSIDYQNQELRIIASLAGATEWIEAFARGENIHKNTAAQIYNCTPEEIDDDQSTKAKRANFTYSYGGKEKTFAKYLMVGNDPNTSDPSSAYEAAVKYFFTMRAMLPEIERYQDEIKQQIKANKHDGYGHIFLGDGRRLFIPAAQSFQGISYRSQGEAAIIIKEGLVQLDIAGLGAYLRLEMHDEVLSEVPEEHVQDFIRDAVPLMERYDYLVPMLCDVAVFDKWGDAHRGVQKRTGKTSIQHFVDADSKDAMEEVYRNVDVGKIAQEAAEAVKKAHEK